MAPKLKLTIKVCDLVLLLEDAVTSPPLDAVEVERAEARPAVPDGVRLFNAGNADQTGSGASPALEAVKQDLLGSDPDGGNVGIADVRLEHAFHERHVVVVATQKTLR